VPPFVPVRVTAWALERVLQKGVPEKLILALGAAVIVTVVVLTAAQTPAAAIV
jgi:hypothetical protein